MLALHRVYNEVLFSQSKFINKGIREECLDVC